MLNPNAGENPRFTDAENSGFTGSFLLKGPIQRVYAGGVLGGKNPIDPNAGDADETDAANVIPKLLPT
jgi:hypothetical protein